MSLAAVDALSLVLSAGGALFQLVATTALAFGAWFFRGLRTDLGELSRQIQELRLELSTVRSGGCLPNAKAIEDHETRIRALERGE